MRRRQVLALFAGGVSVTAGCNTDFRRAGSVAGTPSSSPTESDATSSAPQVKTASRGNIRWGNVSRVSDRPIATRTVGDRTRVTDRDDNRPHDLLVWNDGLERTLDLGLVGESLGRVLDWQPTVPAGRFVRVALVQPDRYTANIGVIDGTDYRYTVERHWFDCNSSHTKIAVRDDGGVEHSSVTDLAGCSVPTTTNATPEG